MALVPQRTIADRRTRGTRQTCETNGTCETSGTRRDTVPRLILLSRPQHVVFALRHYLNWKYAVMCPLSLQVPDFEGEATDITVDRLTAETEIMLRRHQIVETQPIVLVGVGTAGAAALCLHLKGWNVVGATVVMCPVKGASIQGLLGRVAPSIATPPSEFPSLWSQLEGKTCPPPPHPFHCVTIGMVNNVWVNRVWRAPYYLDEANAVHLTGMAGKLELLVPWVWSTCASCVASYCRTWIVFAHSGEAEVQTGTGDEGVGERESGRSR